MLVIAPKPLTGRGRTKELHLQHVKVRILTETQTIMGKDYDQQGRPKENNITQGEAKGIKAAREIIENGDIIRPTDKTSKFCVD